MLVTAAIFSSLALMPWQLMMFPSRIPDGTPKMHLVGFNFHRYTFRGFENIGGVGDEGVSYSRLDHHIIDISLDVLPDLVLEAVLDGSLKVSPTFLSPKDIVV